MIKTFYHYSSSPKLTLRKIRLSPNNFSFKPDGIWLSDDSRDCGWKDWCIAEEFNIQNLAYCYPVIVDMKDILNVNSPNILWWLISNYSIDDKESKYSYLAGIDWKKLNKEFKGISFTPYNRWWHYEEMTGISMINTIWYSTIDCDSACIWDKSCIVDFGKPELTGITEN